MKRMLVLMTALLGSAANAAWTPGSITATDLGTLGGVNSEASAINEGGQIVGWSENSQGIGNGFIHQNGVMSNLMPGVASWHSAAYDINDSGVAVGWVDDPNAALPAKAFRWINGAWSFLNAGFTSGSGVHPAAWATAINNSGLIAGSRQFAVSGFTDALLWLQNLQFIDLEEAALPPSGSVFIESRDLNGSGDVVAFSSDYDRPMRFKWVGFQIFWTAVPLPLPVAGLYLDFGDAYAINDRGRIVGHVSTYANGSDADRAIFWDGSSANSKYIGVLAGGKRSWAYDLNEGEFIVGASELNDQLPPPLFSPTLVRAFVYHKDFGMRALPSIAATGPYASCRANGVNERKSNGVLQIVGSCEGNGRRHAVRWNVNVLSVRG